MRGEAARMGKSVGKSVASRTTEDSRTMTLERVALIIAAIAFVIICIVLSNSWIFTSELR